MKLKLDFKFTYNIYNKNLRTSFFIEYLYLEY